MKIRTRFAPSPTGYMHIGNLRTALYTYLIAKHDDGTFVLRIEDTDQARYVDGAVDVIYDSLRIAGLKHDEGPDIGGDYGPYVQSERRDIYKKYALELVEKGYAYYCFCSKERLDALRGQGEGVGYDKHCLTLSKEEVQAKLDAGEPWVIRQNIPREGTTTFTCQVYGTITVENSTLDDQVLLKSDGLPTYNFANVVDDHLMGITHVLRGNEYLSSTPKYNLLYDAFGWEKPVYIHLPHIIREGGKKLSKRDGDASFADFLNKGFLPEAIINYIALLGWNPGDNREFFTLEELTEAFTTEGINNSPAVFDVAKLTYVNAHYIHELPLEKFHEMILPFLKEVLGDIPMDTMRLAELLQPRCETLPDVKEKIDFLAEYPEFSDELYFNKRMKTNAELAKELLPGLRELLAGVEDFSEEGIRAAVMEYIAANELSNGKVLWPLRVALSGKASTPGGAFEIAYLLGKEESLRRLDTAICRLG